MLNNIKRYKNKGFTLIELLVVIPLIGIILIAAYNLLFLSYKNFNYVNDNFRTAEELRIFQINIKKEVNSARQSEKGIQVFNRISQSELQIYTNIDGDLNDIPEKVRYRLSNNNLLRDEKAADNSVYPYKYTTKPWKNEKVVVSNIKNKDIFGLVEFLNDKINPMATEKDNRRKILMKLVIEKTNNKELELNVILASKSRSESE